MRGNNRNRENTVESRNNFERLREIIFITVNSRTLGFPFPISYEVSCGKGTS